MALDTEFKADRLNVNHLKLNGIDISNFYIETLGDGKLIDSMRGDMMVQITPSMLDTNGEYKIEQLLGLGRFSRAELSMPIKSVYYLSPTGSDSNLGTKDSPWLTLCNTSDNSIVVLLNGTYTNTRSTSLIGYSWRVQECFYTDHRINNLTIVGESKSGVVISVSNATNRLVIPSGAGVLNMVNLLNFTVRFSSISSSSSPYFIAEERYVSNTCNVHFLFYSCTTNVGYNYYGADSSKRYNLTLYSNNNYSMNINSITTDTRYNYLYALNSVLSNLTINSSSIFSSLEKNIDTIQQSTSIDLKSNTLLFKTDIINFDTITMNLWIEQ